MINIEFEGNEILDGKYTKNQATEEIEKLKNNGYYAHMIKVGIGKDKLFKVKYRKYSSGYGKKK